MVIMKDAGGVERERESGQGKACSPMQGMMKNIPGPLDPPRTNRPSLKMTARSYSCTTLTQKKREKGRKTTITTTEMTVSRKEHKPGSSGGKSVRGIRDQ